MNKVRCVMAALWLLQCGSAVAQTDVQAQAQTQTQMRGEVKSEAKPTAPDTDSMNAASANTAPANAASMNTASICPVQGVPTKVLIEYEASATRSGLSLQGEATLEFARTGSDYTLTTTLTAAGVQWAKQTSQGTVKAGALRPTRYSESRVRRAESSALFDWSAQKVMFPEGAEAALREGVQDRLSALLTLSQQQRKQPNVDAFDIAVASLRRISIYHFVRRETATLELPTPLGTVQAVRYEHADEDGDQLEVWLAPQRCALPVRVRSRDHRGQDIDQRARALVVE